MHGDDAFSSSSQEAAIDPLAALIAEFGDSLSQFGNAGLDGCEGKWAGTLVLECGKAISNKAMERVQQLLWILNELASPYGDREQRLAFYFLQALFCKMSRSGPSSHSALCAAMESTQRSSSFDSQRKTILKFQEVSPWTTFGHVACNGAILEAFEGESNVHILDVSNSFCTQWPTFLEALATRADGAPSLRLTTLIPSREKSSMKAMKEVGTRLERFARLMGVPFEFKVHHDLDMAKLHDEHQLATLVDLKPGEVLVINCNQSLLRVSEIGLKQIICHERGEGNIDGLASDNIDGLASDSRDKILQTLRKMNPKILTLVEEEADMVSQDFIACLSESLRFFSLYFETLEASFPRVSDERLMLERTAARSVLNLLACTTYNCDEYNSNSSLRDTKKNFLERNLCEKRETNAQWDSRLIKAGFCMTPFSDDVMDDVRALLKRYKEGWGLNMNSAHTCLYLTWRHQTTVFASAWKC